MYRVLMLMSTYDGGDRIKRQIESIINQNDIDVHILIRDDGSDEATKSVLRNVEKEFPSQITVKFESNEGWIRSFQDLLQYPESDGYDYYAFSDQDDVWLPRKLSSCINIMEADKDYDGPKLCQCNSITSDGDLHPLPEQEIHYEKPRTRKMCIAQEYFRGCSMVWNDELMRLVRKHKVQEEIPHDYWVGLLGYYFGKVYWCDKKLFYHIRYEDSSSSDGDLNSARKGRIRDLFHKKHPYINPSRDLLDGYGDKLDEQTKSFLSKLVDCRNNKRDAASVAGDKEFRRESRASTILLKCAVMIGKY